MDDTLSFIFNCYHSLLHVKRILRWFDLCSGLEVDFSESSLLGINLDDAYIVGMTNEIFCRWDFLPFIYLNLPLGANPRCIFTWKPIISNIQKRLQLWKERVLSLVGRICMIKNHYVFLVYILYVHLSHAKKVC